MTRPRASSEAEAALTSESWLTTVVDSLADALPEVDSRRHQVILLDTDAISEPPWQALEILRERDPHAALLLLVGSETPWSSFSSYRQRRAGLVLKPLDRTALFMAVDSAVVYRRLLEEIRLRDTRRDPESPRADARTPDAPAARSSD